MKRTSAFVSAVALIGVVSSCRSTGSSADQSVSLVRHQRTVLRCEWVALVESESSAATESGVRVLKLKAARLGANALLVGGVMAGDTQGAVAYRCPTKPPEEPPD